MLNFLINVLNEKSSAKSYCGVGNDLIQACQGCDGDCQSTCFADCAYVCLAQSEGHNGSSGNCAKECTGTCVDLCSGTCISIASIYGAK